MYFNKELVKKYQKYFKKKGREFSDDKAQDGLNSMADLYKTMQEFVGPKRDKVS